MLTATHAPTPSTAASRTLDSLLSSSLSLGISNSLLVIGPSSSGKSSLVKASLNKLKAGLQDYRLVWLDGWIHTSDRIALASIVMQVSDGAGIERMGSLDFAGCLTAVVEGLGMGEEAVPLLFVLVCECCQLQSD